MTFTKTKRISVLVPSYNHGRFVERCLRSIIKQTQPPAELLVIDDGSGDDSAKVIERVLKDCPFPCELTVNENKGLCAALNEGLARAGGDYFAYLGSDDLWLPRFLEERYRLLESRPMAVLGYGNGYLIDADDNIYECSADWRNFKFPDGDARPMLDLGTAPISSTVMYRRSALENRRWNEGSKLEDYELYLHLTEDGEFAFDPSVLAAWRRHDRNTSRDLDFMLRECLNAQERSAKDLGWSPAKLKRINTKTRFFFAEEFDRGGDKSKARSLLFGNLSGAPSLRIFFRALFRILIPTFLLEIRNKSIRDKNTHKYGTVQV